MCVGLLELLNDLDRPSFKSLQGIQIRKILVPVDGSECLYNAVKIALDLATKYKSELCLAGDLNGRGKKILSEECGI